MKYETFLRRENLADSTIQNYVWTANYFKAHYPEVNKTNLLSYNQNISQKDINRTKGNHRQGSDMVSSQNALFEGFIR